MVLVLSRRRWGSRWSSLGPFGGLAVLLLLIGPSPAPGQPPAAQTRAAAPAEQKTGKAKDEDEAPAAAPDVSAPVVADPSQTRRVSPVEVFTDPAVEAMLDISKVMPILPVPFTENDRLRMNEMAANPNVTRDDRIVERVVRGLAARLTDKKSIQGLLEEPEEGKKLVGDGGKAIQEATSHLLEPIFLARGSKNDAFLTAYRRYLVQYLPPLLKNHLVPRVQAMIILGEAASPDALVTFQNEIANRSQALWVKLWALEGITNIKKGGRPFPADTESRVGRTISDFLERNPKELPWPIQLRGLEALGWLRQSGLPTQPERAHMANTAMLFLADAEAKAEVRSEAARALGMMHVNQVPKYNFKLVAFWAGQLAADLAEQLNNLYTANPPREENHTKAQYLTALIVGPVYECFTGVQGESNSGLLRTAVADPDSLKYTRQVFDLVTPIAQKSVELLGSPSKAYKARKQELAGEIAALRTFLQQHPPASHRLVDKGRVYGNQAGAGAQLAAPEEPLAGRRRGR